MRGTTQWTPDTATSLYISIHVPRAGDDADERLGVHRILDISIHVPRAGDDTAYPRKETIDD